MKSKKLSSWSLAQRKIKTWIKNNNVVDVVLFGSFARAKPEPNDIDLCIVINERDEAKSLDLIDSLSRDLTELDLKFQINILTEKDLIFGKSSLAHTLLSEGISIDGSPLARSLGYEPISLFLYSLKNFNPSKRVRFHYLLSGRGEEGLLKETSGKILGGGVISVPTDKEDLLSEVFRSWGVDFKIKRVLFER